MAYIRQSSIKTKDNFFTELFKSINKEFGKDNVEKYIYYPDSYNFSKGLTKKLLIKISKDADLSKLKAPFNTLKGLKSSSGKTIDFKQKSKIEFYITGGKNGSGKLPIKGETARTPKTDQQENGTIFSLNYYAKNKKIPTLEEINKEIGYDFDPGYYLSFCEQVKSLIGTKYITKKSRIFLDSASVGDHNLIFKKLKTLGYKDKKDNWNPADIWVFNVSKAIVYKELDEAASVNEYNDIMKRLFEENKLIGMSLKKISGKGNADIVDPSKRELVDFTFKGIDYKPGQANFMINSKEGFIIRAGFKAGAGRVYYEGRMAKSKVQLGAISKMYISEYIKTSIKEDILELEAKWKKSSMSDDIRNTRLISESVRIIKKIIKKDKNFLNNTYYAAMKQMETSSIYLKVH